MLTISNLSVEYQSGVSAVKDISFEVGQGELLTLTGNSGCGKSTILNAIAGLLPASAKIRSGRIDLDGVLLTASSKRSINTIDDGIAYIFQTPGAAFNPVRTIGKQFIEYVCSREKITQKDAYKKSLTALESMNLLDGPRILESYPSQLSGGMNQRVAIALATLYNPKLILADEPTSALDVVSQKFVLDALIDLKNHGTSVLMVTHDMYAANYTSDRVMHIKEGRIAPQTELIKPQYPVGTQGEKTSENQPPFMKLEGVTKQFVTAKGTIITALRDIDLSIHMGERIGIIGESGCGKSTLARLLSGILQPDKGAILIDGEKELASINRQEFRRNVRLVFQNPCTAISSKMRIGFFASEPLRNFEKKGTKKCRQEVSKAFSNLNLSENLYDKYPHQLSGGELQRVCLAQSFMIPPKLVIYDEPTSSLDAVVRSSVLETIAELNQKSKAAVVFISHDLEVVTVICQKLIVMFGGKIVEIIQNGDLTQARHPYTKQLITGVYKTYYSQKTNEGCVFCSQCLQAKERCMKEEPPLMAANDGFCACFAASDNEGKI